MDINCVVKSIAIILDPNDKWEDAEYRYVEDMVRKFLCIIAEQFEYTKPVTEQGVFTMCL